MVCDRANNDDGVDNADGRYLLETRRLHSCEEGQVLPQDYVAAGIDDLAKFHIVQLFEQYPEMKGDAVYFAAYLGFHSVQVTATLLDELVTAGILAKESFPDCDSCNYALTPEADKRHQIAQLYGAACHVRERATVLRVLASRSLAKARARALSRLHNRRNGHDGKVRALFAVPPAHLPGLSASAGQLPPAERQSGT